VERRAVRGVLWTVLSYGGAKAISLIAMLVLARLLMPDDFGLVALATLVIGFVNLFKDLGLGATIVLRQDLDRSALGTLFTLLTALYLLTAGVVAALSPVAALVFNEPRLTSVLALLALSLVVGAVGWFYDALQQRELEFRLRFWAQLVLSLGTWGTSVLFALLGFGVWALVLGQLVGPLVFSVMQVAFAPHRVRPGFDRTVARDVLGTGREFLFQGTLTFLQEQTASFAIGRMMNATQVGFYAMSYRLAELPYMAVADPVAKVTFPGFARMRLRGEPVGAAFLAALRLVAMVATPLGVLLSATAFTFTRGVLGSEWVDMSGLLLVLGLWGAIRPIQATVSWFVNSLGEVRLMGRLTLWILFALVPATVLAAVFGGLETVGWVLVADVTITSALFAYFAGKRSGFALTAVWRSLRPVVVAGVPCWGFAYLVSQALDGAIGALGATAVGVLAGAVGYLGGLVLVERRILRETATQVKAALSAGKDEDGAEPDPLTEPFGALEGMAEQAAPAEPRAGGAS
jgi:PST family polysaccharide transporter